MKKIFRVLAVALCVACLAACLAGCGNNTGGNKDLGLLTDGVLKVGMEIGYPPFELYDDSGEPIGLDIDMANAIGEILGVEVVFEDTLFDGILDGLRTDRYDCVISAVTITGDRAKEVDFTRSYIENWQCIVIKKGNPAVTSAQGMDGLNMGYQEGTTSKEYIEELIGSGAISCSKNPYDKIMNAFDDLKLGRLDAVLADSTVADGYLARDPDAFEMTWIQSSDSGAEAETFGVAVKKGNQKLLKALNDAMAELENNKKLDGFRRAWLS